MAFDYHFTYLLLNVFTISFPLFRSFEDKLKFYTNFKYMIPAMAITAAFFISWDVYFTSIGVWYFNPQYLLGYYILNLPVEEWLFFITIPYACVFIYDCIKYFYKPDIWERLAKAVSWPLVVLLISIAALSYDKWYTAVKLGFTGLFLALHILVFGYRLLGRFYMAYVWSLLGFLFVNGFLTYLPVVVYNNSENLGIRLSGITGISFFNIPVEDTMYSFMLILMNVSLMEYFRNKGKILKNN